MKRGDRYFNKQYWRYMWFTGRIINNEYEFEDAGDVTFYFTEEEINKMERR